MNPTRYTLLCLYVDIHNKLSDQGIKAKDIVDEKTRKVLLSEKDMKIFTDRLECFTIEEQTYLRVLNDHQRYFLGDDLKHIALVLNEILPRFRELENKEKKTNQEVEKLPENTVIAASDLAYDHLAKESEAYIRRLITSALASTDYQMITSPIQEQFLDEMELISANWLLDGTKYDEEALKILSLLGPDGRPLELKDSDVPRFKFVEELMPSLLLLSNFKRSDSTYFSRFVNLLPSTLTWHVVNAPDNQNEEDSGMDLLEATMTFTRSLQANADQAARVRQLLYHGFPVYKDLIELAKSQSYLMSWNFKGIIYRLAQNLSTMLSSRENENQMTRFLMASGILQAYARHKNAYIKR